MRWHFWWLMKFVSAYSNGRTGGQGGMVRENDAIEYHASQPAGKIAITATKPCLTQRDLSLRRLEKRLGSGMGPAKPVHVLRRDAPASDVVNLADLAAVEVQEVHTKHSAESRLMRRLLSQDVGPADPKEKHGE